MEKTNHKSESAGLNFTKRLFFQFLRVFFNLIYHQFAWTYDLVASIVSLGAWKKWILSVLPYLDGPRVLEIGFGPGHLQAALHKKNLAVFGLDESIQMVGMAQRRLKRQRFHPNLIRGDAGYLPFLDESFHQVVMTFPAEYILKSATISEVQRILTPEGTALVLPLAWITGRKPLERLVAWVNRITGESPDWDPRVLDALRTAGFEVTWEMIEYPGSKAVLIKMAKAESQVLRPPD